MQDSRSSDLVDILQVTLRDFVALALRSLQDTHGPGLTHMRLLLAVGDAPGSSCAELARHLHISASSVTRQADHLVRLGHLRRRPGETNRSVVVLELTDDGQSCVEAVLERRRQVFEQAVEGTDREFLAASTKAFTHLHEQLEDIGWAADARTHTRHS